MDIGVDNITAVTVVYKTIDYIIEAYNTFRKFYPTVKYILVDNSGGDECTQLMRTWLEKDPNLTLIELEENIGHGYGMDLGIEKSTTDYLFIFDTDIVFKKGGFIEEALALFDEDTYGVGWIFRLGLTGGGVPTDWDGESLLYLYPSFWFVNKHQYNNFHKLSKFGLPILQAMNDINASGLSEKILKPFFNGQVNEYLHHHSGGTRAVYGDCENIVKGFDDEYVQNNKDIIASLNSKEIK